VINSISFAPLVQWQILATICGVAVALLILAAWLGLRGWSLRTVVILLLISGLSNPSYRQEDRTPLTDIVFLVVDETASQELGERNDQIAETLPDILAGLERDSGDPIETVIVTVRDMPDDAVERGTILLGALERAAAEISPDRIAGAIILSDGRIHDLRPLTDFPAPVHLLQTGTPQDWDRRIVLENGPAYGIVGETVSITLRVEDNGAVPAATGPVMIKATIDGGEIQQFSVQTGESVTLELGLDHAGINLLQFSTPTIDGELTDRNNSIILSINGVRDRLRVLLISGEPYAGERTWRNLLKADASVDLVHFTILRSREKSGVGSVPASELSLIGFPTRELFLEKIDDFDLIIFDRYRRRGVLLPSYFANVARYVRDGGAVLVAAGPAYAGVESLARSSFREVLPAMPTGFVIEQGFKPQVSEIGQRHPVTAGLEDYAPLPTAEDGTPGWGRWFRQIDLYVDSGHAVMEGADAKPLLVLDRVDDGRIAVLASDHAWLWARGYEGGGPQLELLRRLAHWLMKEPELEEEVLIASAVGRDVSVERRSLGGMASAIEYTSPSGVTGATLLKDVSPGKWTALFEASENGVYRLTDGALETVVAVGPASPIEFEQPIGASADLLALVNRTGGGVYALSEIGTPNIRRTREGRIAKGTAWLGLPKRDAYTVQDIRLTPLAPGWLILLLAALFSIIAWRVEGR